MVVGAQGTLGLATMEMIRAESRHELIAVSRGYRADAKGYERWESDQPRAWKEMAESDRWRADHVVNAAAMTAVDACEKERQEAWRSNVEIVEHILGYCRKSDADLTQISTDYVFGSEPGPYREDDRPAPINYYGRTKLAAENACRNSSVPTTIVRTMWLYGRQSGNANAKPDFTSWVRQKLATGEKFKVVEDEYGTPTHYDDLAHAILQTIEKRTPSLIHAAGEERVSRLEWARLIAKIDGRRADLIEEMSARDLNRAAQRPLDSGLLTNHPQLAGITRLPSVSEGEKRAKILAER